MVNQPSPNPKSIEQVESLTDEQIRQLHALYRNEWWSEDRRLSDVREMLAETDLLIGLVESDSGRLLAFCRMLTDFKYHATLYDVIVLPEQRGSGLGRRLLEAATRHPRLRQVVTWLCCLPEMVPFYERWEFTGEIDDLVWMRRV